MIKLDTLDRQATVPLIYSLSTIETKNVNGKVKGTYDTPTRKPWDPAGGQKREEEGERHDECP